MCKRELRSLSPIPQPHRPGRPGLWPFLVLAASALVTAGCGGRVYVYRVPEKALAITVDGKAEEWAGALSYISKEHVFVGFVNDRDFLYVCVTRERSEDQAGAAPRGMTIWLDPAGGTNKVTGIRVGGVAPPNEGAGPEAPEGRRPREDKPTRPGRDDRRRPAPGGPIEVLDAKGQVIAGGTPGQAAVASLGIESATETDPFVFELKIPLRGSRGGLMDIGQSGADVGVGIVAEEAKRRGRPDGSRSGGPGGPPGGGGMPGDSGMPSGMSGGPGGRGGGMLPSEPDLPKPLKIWIKVRLRAGVGPGPATILGISSD